MYFRKLLSEMVKTINHPDAKAFQWQMDKSHIVIQIFHLDIAYIKDWIYRCVILSIPDKTHKY